MHNRRNTIGAIQLYKMAFLLAINVITGDGTVVDWFPLNHIKILK